ncbi:uncharacterized protein DUF3426 [Cupriavidus gilardii J11]|uniref:Uncharacterized protein DUF3426 n=1 Tax=Cupriavidus gilardii J11 TaxID=936133 RepID=A0A562B0L8_9BURK|nr:DUF3426 domain-containing protein [Cupriavidus gilardii]TWG78751.1 uncharacterized protein DUF3426 [Cupriavidus gilardii J11]
MQDPKPDSLPDSLPDSQPDSPPDPQPRPGHDNANRDTGRDVARSSPPSSAAGISAGEYLRAPAADRVDITPTAVAREEALRRSLLGDDAASEGFSDVWRARRRRARLRRVAAWSALPLCMALVGAALWTRAELAGRLPALRPVLEAACAPLGCRVPPWPNLAALRIGASQLERPGQGDDAYRLSLSLLNDSRAAVALPELELTLTDDDDHAVATHRFKPADYLPSGQRGALEAGLAPGGELPVQVRFRTHAETQAEPGPDGPANYRLRILYR